MRREPVSNAIFRPSWLTPRQQQLDDVGTVAFSSHNDRPVPTLLATPRQQQLDQAYGFKYSRSLERTVPTLLAAPRQQHLDDAVVLHFCGRILQRNIDSLLAHSI